MKTTWNITFITDGEHNILSDELQKLLFRTKAGKLLEPNEDLPDDFWGRVKITKTQE